MLPRTHSILFLILVLLFVHTAKAQYKDYELVWSDEFDYSGLPDSANWQFATIGNSWQWGNNEQQKYTSNEPANAYVSNGVLTIKALYEDGEITSARLSSRNKHSWSMGRVDIRASMEGGFGTWFALWMMPENWGFSKGVSEGEIDIMEFQAHTPDTIYHTVHTETHDFSRRLYKTITSRLEHSAKKFHVYSVAWDEEQLSFYIDDELSGTYQRAEHPEARWVFNDQYYIIMNIAVGGKWATQKGLDYDAFPAQMEVDYVRVYQKQAATSAD